MDAKTYMLGEAIIFSAELYDASDDLADASNIRLLVQPPNAASSIVVSVTSGGLGKLSATYTPTLAGIYRYRFESTSGLGAAAEGEFLVEPRQVPAPA
jgi:hypothetical protein